MDFLPHPPLNPELKYLRKDPTVMSLIEMRMNEVAPLQWQKYTLQLSNTSGIKEKTAREIDVALKSMGFSGNATVLSEVKNEAGRYLEYDIEF